MIRSFRSRALKALWESGDRSKLDARMVDRILLRLDVLNEAERPEEMDLPGFNFHALSGRRKGIYTVHVNGPWCLTFRWQENPAGAIAVNFEQYH